MSDYSKWKVTELKAELKNRGIPQTGLRLKQDFIDKLVELDSLAAEQPAEEGAAPDESLEKDDNVEIPAATKSIPPEPQQEISTSAAPQVITTSSKDLDITIPDGPQPATTDVKYSDTAAPNDNASEVTEKAQIESPTEPSKQTDTRDVIDIEQPKDSKSRDSTSTAQAPAKTNEIESEPPTDGGEDLRKRKRRSQSPPPSIETIKKSKIDNENLRIILKEDEKSQDSTLVTEGPVQSGRIEDKLTGRQDSRFKELLPAAETSDFIGRPAQPVQDDDREIEPARHVATSAIYIRNLMRPLQPLSLKKHLQSLAASGNSDSDSEETVIDFFLDSIRTHCFALFKDINTASRVRSRLHGVTWPNERDRKSLWVDFIPAEKFDEWIKTEKESSGANRGNQRWQVVYEEHNDGVKATLQEVRSGSNSGLSRTAPARRHDSDAEVRRTSDLPSAPKPKQSDGKGFKALDERFQSTKTKPKLYFLPVSKEIVDRRLAQFDKLERKHSGHGRQSNDMRRITFEDIDIMVDDGPEYRGGPNRRGQGPWRGHRR